MKSNCNKKLLPDRLRTVSHQSADSLKYSCCRLHPELKCAGDEDSAWERARTLGYYPVEKEANPAWLAEPSTAFETFFVAAEDHARATLLLPGGDRERGRMRRACEEFVAHSRAVVVASTGTGADPLTAQHYDVNFSAICSPDTGLKQQGQEQEKEEGADAASTEADIATVKGKHKPKRKRSFEKAEDTAPFNATISSSSSSPSKFVFFAGLGGVSLFFAWSIHCVHQRTKHSPRMLFNSRRATIFLERCSIRAHSAMLHLTSRQRCSSGGSSREAASNITMTSSNDKSCGSFRIEQRKGGARCGFSTCSRKVALE